MSMDEGQIHENPYVSRTQTEHTLHHSHHIEYAPDPRRDVYRQCRKVALEEHNALFLEAQKAVKRLNALRLTIRGISNYLGDGVPQEINTPIVDYKPRKQA